MVPPQLNGNTQQIKYYRIVVRNLRAYRQNWVQILVLSLASYVILVKITLTSASLFSFFIYEMGITGKKGYIEDYVGKMLKRTAGT